jgi:hypothetical protein
MQLKQLICLIVFFTHIRYAQPLVLVMCIRPIQPLSFSRHTFAPRVRKLLLAGETYTWGHRDCEVIVSLYETLFLHTSNRQDLPRSQKTQHDQLITTVLQPASCPITSWWRLQPGQTVNPAAVRWTACYFGCFILPLWAPWATFSRRIVVTAGLYCVLCWTS